VYSLKEDLTAFIRALFSYFKAKCKAVAFNIERFKNFSVSALMWRRGAVQQTVWHGSMLGLVSVGVLTAGVFGGSSIVSSSFPGVGGGDPRFAQTFEPYPEGVVVASSQETQTAISQKPRSETVNYTVQGGDTLSSIAEKFGISTDTIKWANEMDNIQSIKPGQVLKILPVSGVEITVKSGDTLQSVAKKYQADAQAIVDFPFNDVPDDFSLRAGQTLVVPEGQPPETAVKPKPKLQPQYIAQGPSSPIFGALGGGNFVWPTTTVGISQYFAWYHPGIDMPNPSAPAVAASDGGTVVFAGWDPTGYGNRVDINHGNGYLTRYAHLSNIYVTDGEQVNRGESIGRMGSTGRSTGTHLHFEIHYKGVAINPLAILR